MIECPKKIGPNQGIVSLKLKNNKGNSFPGIPTKSFPIIADKPIPKMVRASPVAT